MAESPYDLIWTGGLQEDDSPSHSELNLLDERIVELQDKLIERPERHFVAGPTSGAAVTGTITAPTWAKWAFVVVQQAGHGGGAGGNGGGGGGESGRRITKRMTIAEFGASRAYSIGAPGTLGNNADPTNLGDITASTSGVGGAGDDAGGGGGGAGGSNAASGSTPGAASVWSGNTQSSAGRGDGGAGGSAAGPGSRGGRGDESCGGGGGGDKDVPNRAGGHGGGAGGGRGGVNNGAGLRRSGIGYGGGGCGEDGALGFGGGGGGGWLDLPGAPSSNTGTTGQIGCVYVEFH